MSHDELADALIAQQNTSKIMDERDYKALSDLNFLSGMLQGLIATCSGKHAEAVGQGAYEAQLRLASYIKGEDTGDK